MLYFFELSDGETVRDADGTDLENMHAARLEAVKIASQWLQARPTHFVEDGSLTIKVKNAAGLILSAIDIVMTDAPVSRPISG
jgi:hypothetical protein